MKALVSLDKNMTEAKKLVEKMLLTKPVSLDNKENIPQVGGVYLFYENSEDGEYKELYVGLAKNLRSRIHTDHLSKELKATMSSLRRSLNQSRKFEFGKGMQDWFKSKCMIAYVEIENPDMRKLVEAMLIASLRCPNLQNKS